METRSGSREFQASSAACTFCRAVSSVKGGRGGLGFMKTDGWLFILHSENTYDKKNGHSRVVSRKAAARTRASTTISRASGVGGLP